MFRSRRPSVCFVTNELYPEDRGGIGRMIYNFARYNQAQRRPVDFHILLGGPHAQDAARNARLEAALQGLATLSYAPDLKQATDLLPHLLGYAAQSLPHAPEGLLATSFSYHLGVMAAERALGHAFDVVEFPDFGGWGQVAIEAKRAGIAYENTIIATRVHSTQGILYKSEPYAHEGGTWLAGQFDAERFSLMHSDLVVGHIPSILEATLEHYDLTETAPPSLCEFPSIHVPEVEKSKGLSEATTRDFLFASRLQHFKRPDLFARAAIRFLDRNPGYDGTFRLAAYGWDQDYIASLKDLVPPSLADRIRFLPEVTAQEREALIAASVIVQPSDYESLCLFAYEASAQGRPLILNRDCLAFGAFDRWKDGKNCLMFDGSVESLVSAMEAAQSWEPQAKVDLRPDRPYWIKPSDISVAAKVEKSPKAPLSVVFFDPKTRAETALIQRNILTIQHVCKEIGHPEPKVQVLVMAGDVDLTEPVAKLRELGTEVIESPARQLDPEELQSLISKGARDVALLVPPGLQIFAEFVRHGLMAMARNADLMLAGGHVEVFDQMSGRTTELRAYFGSAPSVALMNSRILSPVCFLRGEVLAKEPFDFRAGSLWFEAFARRAALGGMPMSILPLLAGRLDFEKSLRAENSSRLTATLVDAQGSHLNLPARLLGLELQRNHRSMVPNRYEISDTLLSQTVPIAPTGLGLSWHPVQYHADLGGLLVHPLDDHVTAAALPTRVARPVKVDATISNANTRNQGGQAAIAFGSGTLTETQLLSSLRDNAMPEDLIIGDWVDIAPGETRRYTMALSADFADHHGRTLYFLTRPRAGVPSDQCHIVFSQVAFSVA